MSKVLYCHRINKPGLVCAQKRHDGVCMAGGGIFGRCKWQEDYPPIPPLPSIEPFSFKVEDGNRESEDYLRGFRDGVLYVHGKWNYYPECESTRCSVCDWGIAEAWESNYCPNCGTQMDL